MRYLTKLRIGIPVLLNTHREKWVASLYVVQGYPPIPDSRRSFDLGCQAEVPGARLIEEPQQMLERSESADITLSGARARSVCCFNIRERISGVFHGV